MTLLIRLLSVLLISTSLFVAGCSSGGSSAGLEKDDTDGDGIGNIYDPDIDGDGIPNVLCLDKGTSKLGQGPIAHSCLVDIEPEGTEYVSQWRVCLGATRSPVGSRSGRLKVGIG